MPYYRWKGITLDGSLVQGLEGARSAVHLERQLAARSIGLMRFKSYVHRPFARRQVSDAAIIQIYRHLAFLLRSGMHLDKALNVAHEAALPMVLKEQLLEIVLAVQDGNSFDRSVAGQSFFNNSATIAMLKAGQQSGRLAQACVSAADYLDQMETFKKTLKSAMVMPLITALFFVITLGGILFFIVPMMAQLFSNTGKALPPATQTLVNVSAFLVSMNFVIFLGGVIALTRVLGCLNRRISKGYYGDSLVLKIPLIGKLVAQRTVGAFMQTVAFLVQSEVHITLALRLAQEGVVNLSLASRIKLIVKEVESGSLLEDALKKIPKLFDPEVISLIAIGQEAGDLGSMLVAASNRYHEAVTKRLVSILRAVQPLMLIVLGVLVCGLLVAVYVPIITLSDIAG